MKDLQAMRAACQASRKAGQPLALATVVKVEGSAYRRPGARMLIHPDGTRLGSVSGGCLEADVVRRAQEVMATGEPSYVLYDSRASNGDLVAELGCKGAVGILIERATDLSVFNSLAFCATLACERRTGMMATVFRVEGNSPVRVGERWMRCAHEAFPVQGETSELATLLPEAEWPPPGQARPCPVAFAQGKAEVLVESLQPPVALLLCGAGQDAVPLAQMARGLGWQVTVLDHRLALLTPERFPGIEALRVSSPTRLCETFRPDRRTAAVLMTHSYTHDLDWLSVLLPTPLSYIGLLGPQKRAERLLSDLYQDGMVPDRERLARVHSPVGLDIGAETPEEIALSILAEIQAVLSQRAGGFLRERNGPIHTTL